MLKVSIKQEIKIGERITEVATKRPIKVSVTLTAFFEKINKIDKPLVRLIKKKER